MSLDRPGTLSHVAFVEHLGGVFGEESGVAEEGGGLGSEIAVAWGGG